MKDVTIRALEVLSSCDVIICEDTRVTKKLLNHYNIDTKLDVYNDHSSAKKRDKIVFEILSGKSIAIVSDAGTPLISDPGFKLVRSCYEAGVKVTTTPGVSSVIAGLTLSSMPSDSFFFGGFLPQNQGQKENFFRKYFDINSTLIFFDRGSRIPSSLQAIKNIFGENVEVSITRELTKLYEEVIVGNVDKLILDLEGRELKGEIVLLINNFENDFKRLSEEQIEEVLVELSKHNSVKSASEIAFLEHGINKKLAYKRLLELKDL